MHVERHHWRSGATGRTMHLVRYGHWGAPVVWLPTSGGDHLEFERYGMPRVAAPWIRAGRLQVFSIDAGGPWTFWNERLTPADRVEAYATVERYAARELLPWVLDVSRNRRLAVVGASYGAFLGANLAFRHHSPVRLFCGLGGVYGLWHRLDGLSGARVVEATPLAWIPGLEEGAALQAMRELEAIELHAAAGDEWLDSSRRLAAALAGKRVPHRLEVLPPPAGHHERWWRLQLRSFLARRFGS